ncbi:hypothetical protein C8R44DRAFT_992668 [Mycena epipterygia]|nr:hypothetical protein C8R44DRAFT_992668 [Mycena epipterygia]
MNSSNMLFSVSESLSDLRQNVLADPGAVRDSMREAEARLSILFSLTERSTAVEQECSDLLRYLEVSSSRIAPVRRLDPETLSKIFLDPTLLTLVQLGSTPPTSICAVSSHWRAVALATPALWSTFNVKLSGGDGTFHTLRLYLSRSQDSPLLMCITAPPFRNMDQVDQRIVNELLQVSERWSVVDLQMSYRFLPLLSSVRGRLPTLDSLSLHFESYSPIEDLDIFYIAPKLHRLSLHGLKFIPQLPRHQVEELNLHDSIIPTLIRLASFFPNLVRLSLAGSPSLPSTPNPDAVLNSSEFVSRGPVSMPVLHYISAPQLSHLHIQNEIVKWQIRPFGDFLTRSGCVLTSMIIANVILHATDLLELFPLIPAVETLTVLHLRPNALLDTVMRALLCSPDMAALLPVLRDLTIGGSYLFSNSALIEMLKSRSGANLHRVDLMLGHRQFTAQDVQHLRALQGVRVSLKCLNGKKPFVKLI